MRKQIINSAVIVLGILSFASLGVYFLALHDIYHDYASPEMMSRMGVSAAPGWGSCTPEWTALQVGFLLMIAFHVLFFVALSIDRKPPIG
jgi:hypothetical protein